MTYDEFKFQFRRLCSGTKHEPTQESIDAWYSRLQFVHADDWKEAVTTLLLAGRFPIEQAMLAAINRAQENRKAKERFEEQTQVERAVKQKPKPAGLTDSERAYNAFRMDLQKQAQRDGYAHECESAHWRLDHPDEKCPGCTNRGKEFAKTMLDGLVAWFDDVNNTNWAKTEKVGKCGFHDFDHTLFHCLEDEVRFWKLKSEGFDTTEAIQEMNEVTA